MKNDSDWIFQHLLKDARFEQVMNTGINIEGAVGEAFDILHGAEVIDEVTDESCFVIAVLTQWLTMLPNKKNPSIDDTRITNLEQELATITLYSCLFEYY